MFTLPLVSCLNWCLLNPVSLLGLSRFLSVVLVELDLERLGPSDLVVPREWHLPSECLPQELVFGQEVLDLQLLVDLGGAQSEDLSLLEVPVATMEHSLMEQPSLVLA